MKTYLFAFFAFLFFYASNTMAQEKKIIEIQGKVIKIENGKDGYTATVLARDKKKYGVTISIPNLDNGEEYRRVTIGETIKLNGEHWMLGKENRITIRKLYPATMSNSTEEKLISEAEKPSIHVKGTVKSILDGDDGYTAEILTAEGKTYFATVSIANMNNHKEYKSAKVGDVIEVTGELWTMGNQERITVRKM